MSAGLSGRGENTAAADRWSEVEALIARLVSERDRFREALMRCGSLAVSDRVDGCVPKGRALQIRSIAYQSCWPEEAGSDV